MPPENPIFFLDRSIGKKLVAGELRQAGFDVLVHDDLFASNALDEEWLERAGREQWIALTKDRKIRYRENEKIAVQTHKVLLFVLVARDCTGSEMAGIIREAAPGMVRFQQRQEPPYIAKVGRSGSVGLLVDLLCRDPGVP